MLVRSYLLGHTQVCRLGPRQPEATFTLKAPTGSPNYCGFRVEGATTLPTPPTSKVNSQWFLLPQAHTDSQAHHDTHMNTITHTGTFTQSYTLTFTL